MDEFKITKKEQNILDSVKEVSLSVSEKNDIKNKLISYSNSHPIIVPTKSSFFTMESFYQRSIYLVPAIAVVLLVVGLNTTDNNSGQIASIETVDTNISESLPAPAEFTTMSAPSATVESATFAEPMMAKEPTSTKKVKSVKLDKSAVMMFSATAEVSTSTATTSSSKKDKKNVSKIKNQINDTYKNFINKFFTKKKTENRDDSNAVNKADRKKAKEDKNKSVRTKSEDSDSYKDKQENDSEDDDNIPVINSLPPQIQGTTTEISSSSPTSTI